MYAIVEIAGHQYKVRKDQQLFVNRLDANEGDKVKFDNVLLLDDNGKVTVGAPVIDGAQVSAKVEAHVKGDKVIVFKKKRRKGYRKKNGFRHSFTELLIDGIVASGAKKAAPKKEKEAPMAAPAPKKEAPKAAAPKAEAPKAEAPKKAAPKADSKPDDLKKIEGIGPKIAETLVAAGISTFAGLAKTAPEKIAEIIADVRGNHVTDTWPKQAQMAADGQWDELKKWQDELDGGKE